MTNKELIEKAVKDVSNSVRMLDKLKVIYKLYLELNVDEESDDCDLNDLIHIKKKQEITVFVEFFNFSYVKEEDDMEIAYYHSGIIDTFVSNQSYPFGKEEYLKREKQGTQHLDINRLKWINEVMDMGFLKKL